MDDALREFRPRRRTAIEGVPLAEALGRVPPGPLTAPSPLPRFARASIDGYAVRAGDTRRASGDPPPCLELPGAVRAGSAVGPAVEPRTAVAVHAGGALPEGADAVLMVEHTAETTPGTIDALRAVAVGDGVVGAGADVAQGDVLAPAGRPLRAHDLGLLAAVGHTVVPVRARTRVAIVSTGDEVVPAGTRRRSSGDVRDAITPALSALVADGGGVAEDRGIVPEDAGSLRAVLEEALSGSDLVVVLTGPSVGARDLTARVVESLCEPGVWCHALAVEPGGPTLLAECAGVPVIGLSGDPLSALVVFRLVGIPLVRLLGGCSLPPPPARAPAVLSGDVPSVAGRLDVVQVQLRDGRADPLVGKPARLSTLVAADGFVLVPAEASGLSAGARVEVELYR